ncbi:hypothetical protein AVEN_145385-1 [Araneus ventricosus]|uniref:Uncharacterized protein n=1 Tax=Araneus ventricosus TaxID=182803 RepID=A0A4Y2TGW3_ARAVE|nr:hypothetical protein AVEN_145385-1 [Araneus ventricosus]
MSSQWSNDPRGEDQAEATFKKEGKGWETQKTYKKFGNVVKKCQSIAPGLFDLTEFPPLSSCSEQPPILPSWPKHASGFQPPASECPVLLPASTSCPVSLPIPPSLPVTSPVPSSLLWPSMTCAGLAVTGNAQFIAPVLSCMPVTHLLPFPSASMSYFPFYLPLHFPVHAVATPLPICHRPADAPSLKPHGQPAVLSCAFIKQGRARIAKVNLNILPNISKNLEQNIYCNIPTANRFAALEDEEENENNSEKVVLAINYSNLKEIDGGDPKNCSFSKTCDHGGRVGLGWLGFNGARAIFG